MAMVLPGIAPVEMVTMALVAALFWMAAASEEAVAPLEVAAVQSTPWVRAVPLMVRTALSRPPVSCAVTTVMLAVLLVRK